MTPIQEAYEELKNNNLALEAIGDLLTTATTVNAERLFFLLKKIADSNNELLEKLVA